jgi:hypothetical protein
MLSAIMVVINATTAANTLPFAAALNMAEHSKIKCFLPCLKCQNIVHERVLIVTGLVSSGYGELKWHSEGLNTLGKLNPQ